VPEPHARQHEDAAAQHGHPPHTAPSTSSAKASHGGSRPESQPSDQLRTLCLRAAGFVSEQPFQPVQQLRIGARLGNEMGDRSRTVIANHIPNGQLRRVNDRRLVDVPAPGRHPPRRTTVGQPGQHSHHRGVRKWLGSALVQPIQHRSHRDRPAHRPQDTHHLRAQGPEELGRLVRTFNHRTTIYYRKVVGNERAALKKLDAHSSLLACMGRPS
jgi:hypothetical protein